MPVVYVLLVLMLVVLAAAIVAVVAISSGHLKINRPRLEHIAERAEEVLDGRGETPQFLERLDERAARRHG